MGCLYDSPTYLDDLHQAISSMVGLECLAGSTVAVAGATGMIGSFIVDALMLTQAERGIDIGVIAMGRSVSRLERRFGCCPFGRTVLVEADVREVVALGSRVDYIVHAASNAHPAAINADPVGTSESNVLGALNLLRWGSARGCRRFLYVSSGEVYGRMPEGTPDFSEEAQGYVDPLSPRSCYPLSKRLAENICVSWALESDMDCIVVRPCHTFGPTSTPSDSRASEQFARRAFEGEDVVLKSAGAQVRSYLHVVDAASGILSAMLAGESGRAYNVASPRIQVSVADLARAFAGAAGVDVVFDLPRDIPTGETPITRQVLDPSALTSLGWRPVYSLAEAVKRTLMVRREEEGD